MFIVAQNREGPEGDSLLLSQAWSPNAKEPFLFATEPKYKSKDVQMYHIYGITEFMRGSMRTVAITDLFCEKTPCRWNCINLSCKIYVKM